MLLWWLVLKHTHIDLVILVINSVTSRNVAQFVNICLSALSRLASMSKACFILLHDSSPLGLVLEPRCLVLGLYPKVHLTVHQTQQNKGNIKCTCLGQWIGIHGTLSLGRSLCHVQPLVPTWPKSYHPAVSCFSHLW